MQIRWKFRFTVTPFLSFNGDYKNDYSLLDIFVCGKSTWWRHDMEIFSALLALCEGNKPVADVLPLQTAINVALRYFCDVKL